VGFFVTNKSYQIYQCSSQFWRNYSKLILFANLDTLRLNGQKVEFFTRLKLTGHNLRDSIRFPCQKNELDRFIQANKSKISKTHLSLLDKLNKEAAQNKKLTIEIRGNNG